jgi:hypothetical protein
MWVLDNLRALAAVAFKRVRRLLRRGDNALIIPIQPPPEIPVTIRPVIVTPIPESPVVTGQKSSHPPATIATELTPEAKLTRRERRATASDQRRYEKARLRQDVWVEPKGPKPIKQERAPRAGSEPIAVVADEPLAVNIDNDPLIVDRINDVDEDVLVKQSELWGEFNFRDSILDQLDRYWVYLERMKHHDAGAYHLYRQLGAIIVPRLTTGTHYYDDKMPSKWTPEEIEDVRKHVYLPTWFKQTRPAFGCIAFGAHSLTEKHEQRGYVVDGKKIHDIWVPRFLYFSKYKRPPPDVQPIGDPGDVYKLTLWWDRAWDRHYKWGVPCEFAVYISRDGERMRVLRSLKTEYIKVIPKRRSKKRRWSAFEIPHRYWHYPNAFKSWADDHGVETELYMAHLFCLAVREQENAGLSMVRVAVSKGDMTATFGVDIRRIAYFFQDRDYQLTEGGLRKRVFHIVRPHVRSDGTEVKMHFRGERKFTWAGYDVEVTVPGLDHMMLSEFNVGMSDEWWIRKGEKRMGEKELGGLLKGAMKRGFGGYRDPQGAATLRDLDALDPDNGAIQ